MLEREIHIRFRNPPLPVRAPLTRNDIYISRQNERCCRFRGEEVRIVKETLPRRGVLTASTASTASIVRRIFGFTLDLR